MALSESVAAGATSGVNRVASGRAIVSVSGTADDAVDLEMMIGTGWNFVETLTVPSVKLIDLGGTGDFRVTAASGNSAAVTVVIG